MKYRINGQTQVSTNVDLFKILKSSSFNEAFGTNCFS